MNFRKAVRWSTFLHMLGFMVLAGHIPSCGGGAAKESHPQQQEDRAIVPKTAEAPMEVRTITKSEMEQAAPKVPHAKAPCKAFFGGIGVVTNGDLITEVYTGYPAANNGIKVGMQILEPDSWAIRGEIGTTLNIRLRAQDGNILTLAITRDKICLEDKP
jgi:hypothetical protein